MANAIYPEGMKGLLDGSIALLTDTIKVLGIDTADETYNAADKFVSDVTAAGIVFRSAALTTKALTITAGKVEFTADDQTVPTVTGDPLEAVILYKDTGSDATSRLIAFVDRDQAGNPIAFTPNGSGCLLDFLAAGILEW
jgi:hypothetical protein